MPTLFPKYKKFLFSAIILAAAVIFIKLPVIGFFKDVTIKVFSAPGIISTGIFDYLRTKGSLAKENEKLKQKLDEMTLEYAKVQGMDEENARLRKLLGFKEHLKVKTISAEIIGRDPNDWASSVIINKGALEGVRNQSAVCSAEGLLGRVVEVSKDRSFVISITHPHFRAGGVIRKSEINGVLVGAGRGLVKMIYIPMDADINKGDIVMTSGYSRIFPEGLPIGAVISVHKSRTGMYKFAIIRPFGKIFKKKEVLCVI